MIRCFQILAIVAAACGCFAQDRRTEPTSKPPIAPSASKQPATTQPAKAGGQNQPIPYSSGSAEVDAILDKLEVKGKATKGLSCDLVYSYVTTIPVTDTQKKVGSLLFARGEPNPRFLVHFTKLVAAGVVTPNEEYYAFDGMWYVERNDAGKNVVRRQMARSGEKKDPFELGKGPFPLPFGQARSEILRHFEVSLGGPEKGAPADSLHLHCVPRIQSSMSDEYSRVEIFVDPRLDVPVRIVTERVNDKSRVEVDFNKINLNDAPAGSRFKVETPPGFIESMEPIDDQPEIDLTPRGDLPGSGRK
jgi:hypothetical protein